MEIIKIVFIYWGLFGAFATVYGLFRIPRNLWDRGVVISGGINFFYSVFVIFTGLFESPPPFWWIWSVAPLGLVIFLSAYVLSFWAAKSLKKCFSSRLIPVEGAHLVTTGPFQICRHPIMLSMLMNWLGTAITLGSVSMLLAFGLVSIFVMKRVALEEENLEKVFKDEFKIYQRKVSVIVPFLNPNSREGRCLESAVGLLKESSQ